MGFYSEACTDKMGECMSNFSGLSVFGALALEHYLLCVVGVCVLHFGLGFFPRPYVC